MSKELVCSYLQDIARHLWEPRQYGYASVMVGAGFSKNAKSLTGDVKMPDWSELTVDIYETLYPKHESLSINDIKEWEVNKIRKTSGKNVLKIAEEYKVIFGRNKLDKLVEQNIKDDQYEPGELHKRLLELPWNDVFTTNYDTLLERTISKIEANNGNYNIIANQQDLPGSIKPRIIKLHGSIPGTKPYILTEEDYRTYPIKYSPLVNTVQQAMLETQLCLIGFSGDDPNFISWLGWLRDNMGENCPKIYLCGIFNKMPQSERKLLENNNIIILDLSLLVRNDSANAFEDAFEMFFNKLVSYRKKEKTFDIEGKNVLLDIRQKDKGDCEKLVLEMSKQRKSYPNYVSFCNKEINNIARELLWLQNYINDILEIKHGNLLKLLLLHEYLWIREKSYNVLIEWEAQKIEELLAIDYNNELLDTRVEFRVLYNEAIVNINLNLVDMYRQDDRDKDIKNVFSRLEKLKNHMTFEQKIRLQLEKVKYNLQCLKIREAYQELNKISNEVSLEWKIRKAFILSRIGYKDECLEILKNVSAEIAQLRVDKNQFASISGYVDLCYRTLVGKCDIPTTSIEINENIYNVRNILNRIKGDLIEKTIIPENNGRRIEKSFNPNSYITHYTFGNRKANEVYNLSFRYLIFLDELCLPIYSDHKSEVILASKSLYMTSTLWRWMFIMQTNDIKVIDKIFTRAYITSVDKNIVTIFYNRVYEYVNTYCINDKVIENQFITKEVAFDVLSRLSIVIPERIVELVSLVIKVSSKKQQKDVNWIKRVYDRIGYCIDKEMLSELISEIIDMPLEIESPCRYFCDQGIQQDVSISNDVIERIVLGIDSLDIKIRDEALIRLWMILPSKIIKEKSSEIEDVIWKQLDHGIPRCNLFQVSVWNDFPHPEKWDIKEILKNKLIELHLPRCYNNGVISERDDALDKIALILSILWDSSYFGNQKYQIELNSDEIMSIFNQLREYIENEVKCLDIKYDILGMGDNAKRRFTYLAEIISLLAFQMYFYKYDNKVLWEELNTITNMLNKNDICTLAIRVILNLKAEESIAQELKEEIKNTWVNDEKAITRQAFLSLLFIVSFNESESKNRIWAEEMIDMILTVLPYLYDNNVENKYDEFRLLVRPQIYMNVKIRDKVSECITRVINVLLKNKNNENGIILDALYNMSIICRQWYEIIISNNDNVSEEMKDIIKLLQQFGLPEVKREWNMIKL